MAEDKLELVPSSPAPNPAPVSDNVTTQVNAMQSGPLSSSSVLPESANLIAAGSSLPSADPDRRDGLATPTSPTQADWDIMWNETMMDECGIEGTRDTPGLEDSWRNLPNIRDLSSASDTASLQGAVGERRPSTYTSDVPSLPEEEDTSYSRRGSYEPGFDEPHFDMVSEMEEQGEGRQQQHQRQQHLPYFNDGSGDLGGDNSNMPRPVVLPSYGSSPSGGTTPVGPPKVDSYYEQVVNEASTLIARRLDQNQMEENMSNTANMAEVAQADGAELPGSTAIQPATKEFISMGVQGRSLRRKSIDRAPRDGMLNDIMPLQIGGTSEKNVKGAASTNDDVVVSFETDVVNMLVEKAVTEAKAVAIAQEQAQREGGGAIDPAAAMLLSGDKFAEWLQKSEARSNTEMTTTRAPKPDNQEMPSPPQVPQQTVPTEALLEQTENTIRAMSHLSIADDHPLRTAAAIKIQAGYRGLRGRRHSLQLKMQKQHNEAAIKIQASYRGFRARRESIRLRQEQQVKPVTYTSTTLLAHDVEPEGQDEEMGKVGSPSATPVTPAANPSEEVNANSVKPTSGKTVKQRAAEAAALAARRAAAAAAAAAAEAKALAEAAAAEEAEAAAADALRAASLASAAASKKRLPSGAAVEQQQQQREEDATATSAVPVQQLELDVAPLPKPRRRKPKKELTPAQQTRRRLKAIEAKRRQVATYHDRVVKETKTKVRVQERIRAVRRAKLNEESSGSEDDTQSTSLTHTVHMKPTQRPQLANTVSRPQRKKRSERDEKRARSSDRRRRLAERVSKVAAKRQEVSDRARRIRAAAAAATVIQRAFRHWRFVTKFRQRTEARRLRFLAFQRHDEAEQVIRDQEWQKVQEARQQRLSTVKSPKAQARQTWLDKAHRKQRLHHKSQAVARMMRKLDDSTSSLGGGARGSSNGVATAGGSNYEGFLPHIAGAIPRETEETTASLDYHNAVARIAEAAEAEVLQLRREEEEELERERIEAAEEAAEELKSQRAEAISSERSSLLAASALQRALPDNRLVNLTLPAIPSLRRERSTLSVSFKSFERDPRLTLRHAGATTTTSVAPGLSPARLHTFS